MKYKTTPTKNKIYYNRKKSFYEKYIKRIIDIVCSLVILGLFAWLYLLISLLVMCNLGRPVLFKQPRPGIIDLKTGKEKIFYLYKFRTMSIKRDEHGELLPDIQRLGRFGRMLRTTALDEIPEFINILKGDMSIIGPRPQLVKDMVFMSDEQRCRHTAKPGLSGLAQINGRNSISWEEKFEWDLEYIERISFRMDVSITFRTLRYLLSHSNTSEKDKEADIYSDYGDYLLERGLITMEVYESLQEVAAQIVDEWENN